MRTFTFIAILTFLMTWPGAVMANEGSPASSQVSGDGKMVTGPDRYNFHQTKPIHGTITLSVKNNGDRGSSLQNIDDLHVDAGFSTVEADYQITIQNPMIHHPNGEDPTWFGVVYNQPMHGNTGTGTDKIVEMEPDIALWGWAEVYKDGVLIHSKAPAHVKVSEKGPLQGIAMEIGLEGDPIPNTPNGYLHVFWQTIDEMEVPITQKRRWEAAGLGGLLLLNVCFGWLAIRETDHN